MPFGRSTVKHYIIEKFTRIFISANAASVRRRAFRYNHAYILAVGAGAPTLQFYRFQAVGCCALSFPLVGNAHRAFRGGKLGRMTFGRATVKHEIDEKITV